MIKKDLYVPTGMDQDTTPSQRKNDTLWEAENIKIMNNGRNLSIKPLKASTSFNTYLSATEVLLGSIEARGNLYIFTRDTNLNTNNIAKINEAYRLNLLTQDLNITTPVEIVANYENDDIIKLYWTDGVNQLRFINVADPSSKVNLVEPVDLVTPTTSIVTGGNLINGNIQYVYSLYDLNGSESVLSPASNIQSICNFMDGGPSGESSGLSVQVDISSVDTTFEYIRLYSIHWQEKDQSPKITLIVDELIDSGGTFSFVDDGNTPIAELSSADLFSIGGRPLVVGTLAAKRNRLFIANYSAANFDFYIDTRAFAHNSAGTSYAVKNADGTGSTTYTLPTVPIITHDCVNSDYDTYKYTTTAGVYGAEGVNIKVEFDNSEAPSYSSVPHKSMKQNEIYRIGIKFFNQYGQATPVKWVVDIKVPAYYLTGQLRYIIGLKVNLTAAGASAATTAGAVGYQIVTVERKPWDRSIVSQGFIVPGVQYDDGAGNLLSPYTHPYYLVKEIKAFASTEQLNIHKIYQDTIDFSPGSGTHTLIKDNTTMFFYSSDTMFESEIQSVDAIRIIGTFNYDLFGDHTKVVKYTDGVPEFVYTEQGAVTSGYDTKIGDPSGNFPRCTLDRSAYAIDPTIDTFAAHLYHSYVTFNPSDANYEVDLLSPSVRVAKGETKSIDGTITASNIVDIKELSEDNVGATNYFSKFDASVVLRFDTTSPEWHSTGVLFWDKFASTQGTSDKKIPIVELIRSVPNQYGGSSYEAKQRNSYLDNGNFVAISTSQVTHYVGDIFIAPLVVNRCDSEDEKRDHYWSLYEYVYIKDMENNHNLCARYDEMYNWWSAGLNSAFNYQLFRIVDNHKLASGFNQQPNFFMSASKPVNFNAVDYYPNTVQASQQKFPNELIDSWTKFPVNENKYLEGIYGTINKLYNFNGEIYAFQDSGIALLSINPRIQTQATDGVNIELGIGAVLYDHKYISTNYGSDRKFSIVDNGKQLFYYDSINNNIHMLVDDKISTLLGIRNIMEANPTGVRYSIYHRKNDDVIFKFDAYSLVFNSLLQKFVCILTHETSVENNHMTLGDKLLYKRVGSGIYEKYDATTYLSSSVTYLFCPMPTMEKVFDNLEYRLYGSDFTYIQVTGNLNSSSLEVPDIKNKFDNHRIHLPRISATRERFREHSILVKLINDSGLDYSLDNMVIMYNVKG